MSFFFFFFGNPPSPPHRKKSKDKKKKIKTEKGLQRPGSEKKWGMGYVCVNLYSKVVKSVVPTYITVNSLNPNPPPPSLLQNPTYLSTHLSPLPPKPGLGGPPSCISYTERGIVCLLPFTLTPPGGGGENWGSVLGWWEM